MAATLEKLRAEVEKINFDLLDLLTRRAQVVTAIGELKSAAGLPTFVPAREQKMLEELVRRNRGPFPDEIIRRLFKEIFQASVELQDSERGRVLKTSRARRPADLRIEIGDAVIGGAPVVVAGPCSVESEEQIESAAAFIASLGLRFIRGGAFKPRSSPYSFQGLGPLGLELLGRAARRHGLCAVTEVVDPRHVELVCQHAHVLQVGARNMYNYELLREVGRTRTPVLLKRGLSATIDELLWSAEYVVLEGNEQVILCERGIRTYETQTRNTLDLSAVALLRQRTFLPVVVDVSHAAGRRDILAPLARAALAAGAQGLMVEVHPCPAVARSDAEQQLDFDAFERFLEEVGLRRTARRDGHAWSEPGPEPLEASA
jgi:3-deoxy-7-phosphoheptulonate synthase / chorismate mutase